MNRFAWIAFALTLVASGAPRHGGAASPSPSPTSTPDEGLFDRLRGVGVEPGVQYESRRVRARRLAQLAMLRMAMPRPLRPVFGETAYTLPPGTWTFGQTLRPSASLEFFREDHLADDWYGDLHARAAGSDTWLGAGFDLGGVGLRDFSAMLNVPYFVATLAGVVHPEGVPEIRISQDATVAGVGDVSLHLKKRVLDQAYFPATVALAVALFLPTGRHDERFGSDGRVWTEMPVRPGDPWTPPLDCAAAFDDLAVWPRSSGPYPYNGGVFDAFGPDGRLPTPMQPGTGRVTARIGATISREFLVGPEGMSFSRVAVHGSLMHRRTLGDADGTRFGDVTEASLSTVTPLYGEWLDLDLTVFGSLQQPDSYAGEAVRSFATTDAQKRPAIWFRKRPRRVFAAGRTAFVAPGLVFSPLPGIRMSASAMFRVASPAEGPAPRRTLLFSTDYMF